MDEVIPKYKLGDLVQVVEIAYLMEPDADVKVGDIGIIVSMDPYDYEFITLWGIDYMVAINGTRILFFENEIELMNKQGKTS